MQGVSLPGYERLLLRVTPAFELPFSASLLLPGSCTPRQRSLREAAVSPYGSTQFERHALVCAPPGCPCARRTGFCRSNEGCRRTSPDDDAIVRAVLIGLRGPFDSLRSLRAPLDSALCRACHERGPKGRVEWCGRGDSNPHGIATASPSSWCVCQFRHFRFWNPEPRTKNLFAVRVLGK